MSNSSPRCIHGLGVACNAELPGFVSFPLASKVDLRIVIGELPAGSGSREDALQWQCIRSLVTDDGHVELRATRVPSFGNFRLDYDDGTVVVVDRHGKAVWATWPDSVSAPQASVYLLGPVMGVVLRARGVFCLHASAVSMFGGAVALVGATHAGKSSTAAALEKHGFAVIADDMLPIYSRDDGFEVAPSLPRLRLWPDSAAAIYGSADGFGRLWPRDDKRLIPVKGIAAERHVPLRAVYLLDRNADADRPEIRAVAPAKAMIAMVGDSFAGHYEDAQGRATEFDFVSRIVAAVPTRLVRIPPDFHRLPDVARAIAVDAEEIGSVVHASQQAAR
jgi:hypothetical protein